MGLTDRQDELCRLSRWDFCDLRSLFINCALKPAPKVFNTPELADAGWIGKVGPGPPI